MGAQPLDIIDDPTRARAALQPIRLRLLHLLERPQSAPQLAKAIAMPRQRVLYHLRMLEAFEQLVKDGFPHRWLIAGPAGHGAEVFESALAASPARARVEWRRFVDDAELPKL